jgi:hypothetical protein
MAPSKKPLFDPPPLTTLDHFFAKPDKLNGRHASSQVQKRAKARRLSFQTTQRTSLKREQPSEMEIIVLDSDDDDDAPVPPGRTKRKAEDHHAGSSSDIEVVEAVSRRSHDAPSSGKKKAKVKSGPNLSDVGTDDLLAFAQDDALHFAEFGKPQLLVHAEDHVLPCAEDQNFQPASCSRSDDQRPVATPATPSADSDNSYRPFPETQNNSSSVLPSCSTQADSYDVIEIDDEWGTGDDELVRTNGAEVDDVLELTDEEEIEGVLKLEDESPATPGDFLDQCPFCGITLTSLSSLVCFFFRDFPSYFLIGLVSGHAVTHYHLLRLVLHCSSLACPSSLTSQLAYASHTV